MKTKSVSEVQADLQKIADQKGAAGFEQAKALYLEGVLVTDAEGNPLAPDQIAYEVKLMPATAAEVEVEEDAVKPSDEMPIEDAEKAVRNTVQKTIAAEVKAAAAPRITMPDQIKIDGRARHLKSAEEAYRFGRFIMAARGHRKSLDWCQSNGIVTKGHTESVNSAGGFLVPDEFESSLISLRERYGVFRRNAKNVPMSSDTRRMPRRKTTLTAYAVGEAAAGTESQQVFDQVNLVAQKFMVLTTASNELNEDAIVNLGDDIANEIAYAFALKEDECGFNGDGTSTYGGIVGVIPEIEGISSAAGISDAALTSAYSDFDMADLMAFVAKLPAYADSPNCKFYCSKAFYHACLERLVYASGGVTARELKDGTATPTLLGYPVEYVQVMRKTFTADTIQCLFGDLAMAAYFGDRRQTSIAFSDSALNAFEQDEVAVRGTERFDIKCANLGDATDAGPIVALKL
ncbi:MAG: phage major capsid protein [Coriobacteriia bacterium]|nr:phage major capsid protein [Coriobacteriia bacterium]